MGSPTVAGLFSQRVVIGVGDLSVSNNPQLTLSTYALGSCVAVVVYDPGTKAAGLLHLMLPESTISPDKAIGQPAMFADTGLPLLFRGLAGVGGQRNRYRILVAGGANVLNDSKIFRIGERNVTSTFTWLERNGLAITQRSVGGNFNRTVHLDISTGKASLKTPTSNESYSLGY
jgi:chemotaxis protein CheD